MNKCPTFSGRDTEWSEWSFLVESVAAMANLEPVMEVAPDAAGRHTVMVLGGHTTWLGHSRCGKHVFLDQLTELGTTNP